MTLNTEVIAAKWRNKLHFKTVIFCNITVLTIIADLVRLQDSLKSIENSYFQLQTSERLLVYLCSQ